MSLSKPLNVREFSQWMDLIRWLAAFIVVISHVGGPLLVALSDLPEGSRPVLQFGYSFVAGFAHYAVIIFLVLSGYFVGGSLCFQARRETPAATEFFAKRLARLWIVLIPALLLTYVLNHLGGVISPEVYLARKDNVLDAGTMVCNAVFLQNVLCNRYGSNDSLWSLYNEFWYYLLFFCIVRAVLAQSTANRLVCVAVMLLVASTLTVMQFANAPLVPYMTVWLAGVYVAYAKRPRFMAGVVSSAVLLVGYLLAVRVVGGADHHGTTPVSFALDIGLAILFVKFLVNLKFANRISAPPGGELNTAIAGFSYTLYCVHLPLTLFYSAVAYRISGLGHEMVLDSVSEWGVLIGCLVFVVAASYVFAALTEKRTASVRLRLMISVEKMLSRRASSQLSKAGE